MDLLMVLMMVLMMCVDAEQESHRASGAGTSWPTEGLGVTTHRAGTQACITGCIARGPNGFPNRHS